MKSLRGTVITILVVGAVLAACDDAADEVQCGGCALTFCDQPMNPCGCGCPAGHRVQRNGAEYICNGTCMEKVGGGRDAGSTGAGRDDAGPLETAADAGTSDGPGTSIKLTCSSGKVEFPVLDKTCATKKTACPYDIRPTVVAAF